MSSHKLKIKVLHCFVKLSKEQNHTLYYTRNQVPEGTANKHCANSGKTAVLFMIDMIDLLFSYVPWIQTEEHKS